MSEPEVRAMGGHSSGEECGGGRGHVAAIDMGGMGAQNESRRVPQENGSTDNDHPEWRSASAARTEFRAKQEAPAPARAQSMQRKKRSAKAVPLEREIELALEPGVFISDRGCCKFSGKLDALLS